MNQPVCDVCGYPVRDVTRDFGPDGDHAPCAATMRRMQADLERRATQREVPAWAQPW